MSAILRQGRRPRCSCISSIPTVSAARRRPRCRRSPARSISAIPASPIADPRWVGTGEKVYNNKGKPIRQYEPFFSATPQFSIEKWGVSSTLFYDPVERVVATLHPNNTFEKVVFDPWRQTSYDVNDTVTFDPKTDPDVGEFLQRASRRGLSADLVSASATAAPWARTNRTRRKRPPGTPTRPPSPISTRLGRTFLTIADNGKDASGNDQKYRTRTVLDIEGNQREVIDALGRIVMRYDYDVLGAQHPSGEHGGRRALDAQRRRRQADPRLEQPQICVPHGI